MKATRDPATTRLHLVRHGLVEDRWLGRLYGDLDVSLSEFGRDQAREAARTLADVELAAVASSDLARAIFGAEAIAASRGLEVAALPGLREISRGDWAGQRIVDLRDQHPGALEAWNADPEHVRPPAGESISDLRARVLPALEALASASPGADVAIVAHGWVIRSTVGWTLGLPAEHVRRLHVPPASITTIDWPVGSLERCGLEIDTETAHRDRPYLVGANTDREAPAARGWYRAPNDPDHRVPG
ncbi:histidine phosphatase family protein [Engelhardtia mirabilis]|uniref:histidine phosphatase family protein n=1 Tax=Engelhardtia mirabilis TaxID=2528011 RepID=UPI003AF380E5